MAWTTTRGRRLNDSSGSAISDWSTGTVWSDAALYGDTYMVNYTNSPAGSAVDGNDKMALSPGTAGESNANSGGLASSEVVSASGSDIVLNNTSAFAGTEAANGSANAAAAVDATFDVSTSGSGLVFDNTAVGTYSGNALSEFENDIVSAETLLEKQATNAFTISVELDGQNQGNNGYGADNNAASAVYSYSQLVSALKAKEADNPIGQIALQHLPPTDPSGGAGFYVYTAYARFLGLSNASGGVELNANGNYTFSSSYPFDSAVALNTYYVSDYGQDAIDALTHELSETEMGRVGSSMSSGQPWTIMDLFRYNAAGQYDTQDGRDGKPAYFSYNGGQTTSLSANLAFNNNYNTQGQLVSPGDSDDFTPNSAADIFGPVSTVAGLSTTDDQILEALGWEPATIPPTVTGQSLSVSENQSVSPTMSNFTAESISLGSPSCVTSI
jgi:hypothetical protein